jgi:hypothetical protein
MRAWASRVRSAATIRSKSCVVARAQGREFLIWRRWRSETKSSMELSMSFDLRVLRNVESEGAWPDVVDGMIEAVCVVCCIAVGWYFSSLGHDDVDGISFFAPSESVGIGCRGNLSWVVLGGKWYSWSRGAMYAISRCSSREAVSRLRYGIGNCLRVKRSLVSLRFMQWIVSCSCVARANDDDPLAQPNWPPTSSRSTFVLRRALIRRPPCLSSCLIARTHHSCHRTPTLLLPDHPRSLTSTGTFASSASDDSHNTSIVSRRIAFQPNLRVFISATPSSRPIHTLQSFAPKPPLHMA